MMTTSNKPVQRPLIRPPLLILLIATAILGASVGAYRYISGRPLLIGQDSVRIDEVWLDIDASTGALQGAGSHTYRLTNRTRRPVTITDVRSSCGCTVPTINANTVEPGEEVEVAATIHLDRPGLRAAEVFLHIEGRDAVQILALEAVGRSRSPLRAEPHRIVLSPDRAVTARVIAEVWGDDDREPRLSIRVPGGVEADLANWSLWRPADRERHVPMQWAGAVHVSLLDEGALGDEASLEIVLDDEHALRVPLILQHSEGQ